MDVGALVQALLDSKKGEIQYHRIGALPQGFYDGMILRDDQGKISGKILVTASKRKTLIMFENTRYEACCPAFLFSFTLAKGRIGNTKVFAIKGTNWNLREVLKRLEKLKEFPERLLVPSGITIKDLLR